MSQLARARLLHGKLHQLRRLSLPATARSNAGDSCGCAMGAKFLAAGLILSILWYAWLGHASGLSIGGIVLRIFLWCFLAAGAGKLVGLVGYSLRQQRLRLRKWM